MIVVLIGFKNINCYRLKLQLLISAKLCLFSFLSLISFYLFSLYLVSFSNKSKYCHHRSLSLWLKGACEILYYECGTLDLTPVVPHYFLF